MEPVNILLVEDNEGDILLTKEAFEDAKIHIKLTIARDGKEAINFFNKHRDHPDGELPDLVLLDINLPKKSGHEVLKDIKENENSKNIPVIMLTTSSSDIDINQSYHNYANCYITKPVEVNDFLAVIASIESF